MQPDRLLVEQWIQRYMARSENNTMKEIPGPAFDAPLVGFSRADDALYSYYKEHIGSEFYRLPQEWLKSRYGYSFDPSKVSVISWALPQTADNRAKSRAETDCPTLEWQMVRVHGEECNRGLAQALENWFYSQGIEAIAPMCSEQFSWGSSD